MPDQLENSVIEIQKPNAEPILISTWYRPPGTTVEIFLSFESVLEVIDCINDEFYLL